jgi:hypothetical protein
MRLFRLRVFDRSTGAQSIQPFDDWLKAERAAHVFAGLGHRVERLYDARGAEWCWEGPQEGGKDG